MRILKLFLSIFVFFISFHTIAFAEEKSDSFPFIIMPVIPENQNPSVKGYFDLAVSKGKNQNLQIKIKNISNKNQMVRVIPTNALTSLNGEIEYIDHEGNKNSFLIDKKFELLKYISIAPIVEIKANETKTVPLALEIPEANIGTYLGGVSFIPEGQYDEYELNGDKGVAFEIQNQIAFTMAIQLNFPKKDESNIKISKSGAKFLPSGIQIYTQITNEAAKIQKNVKGDYIVRNKDGKKLFSGKIKSMDMAPKSSIRYPVSWDDEKISSDEFVFEMNLYVDGKKISSQNSFEIKNGDLKDYQEEFDLPTTKSNKLDIKMIGIGILLVIITLIAGIIISQREKK